MSKFEDAVEWVTAQAKDIVVDHVIDVAELSLAEMMLNDQLPVRYVKSDTAGESHYMISDLSAIELVRLAKTIPGAYDLAAKITATNILDEHRLPEALRLFAFQVLLGKRKRPRPNPRSKRHKTWTRNIYLYGLARGVADQFDLSLTRNDSSSPQSACDAVVQGLSKLDHHTTFKAIKDICIHKSSLQMRLEYARLETVTSRSFLASIAYPIELNFD